MEANSQERRLDLHQLLCYTVCLAHKPDNKNPAGLLQSTSREPWEKLETDFMGTFPKSKKGKMFLLVVIDFFSFWVELFLERIAELTGFIHP